MQAVAFEDGFCCCLPMPAGTIPTGAYPVFQYSLKILIGSKVDFLDSLDVCVFLME